MYLAVLLTLLIGQVGRNTGNQSNQGISAISNSSSPNNSDIRVFTSSQESQGITQAQMDQSFLNNLESYTRERIEQLANEHPANKGRANASLKAESQAVYFESGNSKLAIIRLRGNDGSNQVIILGIIGNQLKRVICVSPASSSAFFASFLSERDAQQGFDTLCQSQIGIGIEQYQGQ